MTTSTREPGYRPCVGVMVINAQGLVWVGRRADHAHTPKGSDGKWWQMPQGGIDDGEAPREAAIRELREETGIRSVEVIAETPGWLRYELPPELVGRTWKGRWRGQEQKWFACRFLGPDSEVDIEPQKGHEREFDQWRWVAMSQLVDLIIPFKREVYTEVVASFSHLGRPAE